MNIYSRKQKIKFVLLVFAGIVGIASLWYSNNLVKKLAAEERIKIELWAHALQEIQDAPIGQDVSSTLSEIIEKNATIPVILADETGKIITHRNFEKNKAKNKEYLEEQMETMKENGNEIEINFSGGKKNHVYYSESTLLTTLFYYPFVQITVISLFFFVSYIAFSSSRQAEENQVWVGMSKETAHQLGTPLSSLLAWVELLKLSEEDNPITVEVEKDVKRLETITERFSKIGSKPKLEERNIIEIIENSVEYLKTRTSRKVVYSMNFHCSVFVLPVSASLFEWVIENLCRNAIDAMNSGEGKIMLETSQKNNNLIIDVSDTGKGIPKSKFKTVFKPGYTTKKRGWGLGLSLTKRIIETYHKGKIYIRHSELEKGTSFRIILKG